MISLLPLDVFGMQSDTITHDGVLFKPLIDMEIVVPNFFVSKCAKIIEIKKNGKIIYLKHQEWYRGKKEHGEFKGMRVEFSTDIQPYLDNGHQYSSYDKFGKRVRRKLYVHTAVLQSWDPYRPYLEQMLLDGIPEEVKEQALSWPGIMNLIDLAVKNCMIDHIDDNPRNNNIDNLRYSNLRDNANHRKKWESLDKR